MEMLALPPFSTDQMPVPSWGFSMRAHTHTFLPLTVSKQLSFPNSLSFVEFVENS